MHVFDALVAKVMRLAMANQLRSRAWTVYGLYRHPCGCMGATLSLDSLDDLVNHAADRLTAAARAGLVDQGLVEAALDAACTDASVLQGIDRVGLLGAGFIGTTLTEAGYGCTARLVLASGTVHTGFQDSEASEPNCQIRTGTEARQAIEADEILTVLDRLLQTLLVTT